MTELLSATLGFLLGLFSKFVYDWSLDRRERRTIRLSLLLELLYMHEPTLRLLLDRHLDYFKKGKFPPSELGEGFWHPTFPTRTYGSHIAKIDRLFGSDVSLQLHYYYSLMKNLNEMSSQPSDFIDQKYAMKYLSTVAHAYAMGNGAVEALLGNSEAMKALEDNLKSLLKSFDDLQERKYIADILTVYNQKGAASSIKHPPPRRSKGLLRSHWF